MADKNAGMKRLRKSVDRDQRLVPVVAKIADHLETLPDDETRIRVIRAAAALLGIDVDAPASDEFN